MSRVYKTQKHRYDVLVVVLVFALGTRADDDDRHHDCGLRCSHDQVQFESKAHSVLRCGMRLENEERACGMGLQNEVAE